MSGPLVLGATGQIGTAFRAASDDIFSQPSLWQARDTRADHIRWDILEDPEPQIECSGIICLAGSVQSTGQEMTAIAQRVVSLGQSLGVPTLIASSQAVYGGTPGPHSETSEIAPSSAYGMSRAEMEREIGPQQGVCFVRIGNVPGADMLFGAARRGGVTLDRFSDGRGPVRSMIGIVTLGRTLDLLLKSSDLPPVLNVAQPGMIAMDELLRAANVTWDWKEAPETATPRVELDISLLSSLVDLPLSDPTVLVSEAKACGLIS